MGGMTCWESAPVVQVRLQCAYCGHTDLRELDRDEDSWEQPDEDGGPELRLACRDRGSCLRRVSARRWEPVW